jgi:hypothetical protein
MPLELVGKGVDMVSRLDYTTQLSDSPTVCGDSPVRALVICTFGYWIEHHIGAIGLYKPVNTFSSKYNGNVISSSKHRF